jgi:hypothetical protein
MVNQADVSFSADNSSDDSALIRTAELASGEVAEILRAHHFFRHCVLEQMIEQTQRALFGEWTRSPLWRPAGGWAEHVKTVLEPLAMSRSMSATSWHYVQRWARQLLDPLAPIELYRSTEKGLGVRVKAHGGVTVEAGHPLLNDYLDGLVVFPTDIPTAPASGLMSVYRPRDRSATTGILVGPLSLVNCNPHSRLVLVDCSPHKMPLLVQAEEEKPPNDRIWAQATAPHSTKYVWVAYRRILDDDGRRGPTKVKLSFGQPIEIVYGM